MYTLLNTVGLEIEVNNIPYEKARGLIPGGWGLDDDGSCRTYRRQIGGVTIANAPKILARNIRDVKHGAEFVSPPIELGGGGAEKAFQQVAELLSQLQRHGEQISDLTSFHVHVHTGIPPLNVMHNLIWLWQALEAPFYRLSVAEHAQHRGIEHHNYMYCRPLSAPQIVKGTDGVWYYAFDLDKLLSYAKTTREFVCGMCRADVQPNKWQPFRYYGINFGNYFNTNQTTEFRVFNQTMQLAVIKAWVELCVAFVRVAYMDRSVSGLSPFPLGDTKPKGGGEFTLYALQDIIPPSLISDGSWETLERLWDGSDWQPGCRDQLNHLCRTQDKHVAISDLPALIRPDTVPQELVDEIWDRYDFKH